ncbi:hypothetical protein JL100_010995 [Skermanella mucosa]|uniref:hypothetical protein n=1 Tax=Skermanella mucosa TaxID=1789672 RepID=UPI00192C6F63|nr:hypothetical protein [Skermanella mucosa]UEM23235.1 hypothetical protein JL100_010995 [Skermanella mucosa]
MPSTPRRPDTPNRLPALPPGVASPFHYASLSSCMVHYLVDPVRVMDLFKGSGLRPAIFGDGASVSYGFHVHSAFRSAGLNLPPEQWSPSAAGIVQELELSIVACPEGRGDEIPDITFDQWLMGDEQTKLLGNHRLFMPCDDPAAVAVGRELFGDPVFKTGFLVNLPAPNPVRDGMAAAAEIEWMQTWGFRVNDPDDPAEFIFTALIDTTGLAPLPGMISPVSRYGVSAAGPVGCRWSVTRPFDTFFIADAGPADRVRLTYGASPHPMGIVMRDLLEGTPAYAIQTFQSDPVAVRNRPYFLKPV